ncbi:hypothetical protein Bhyg_04357, partial [Pseudolycoriella hygida]
MNSLKVFSALLVTFSVYIIESNAYQRVVLYEHADQRGESVTIDVSTTEYECVNVPSYMNDRASSVGPSNLCVVLCEHNDCKGRCKAACPIQYYSDGPGIQISMM